MTTPLQSNTIPAIMDDPVPAKTASRARHPEQTNIKETIESILVAFILAFMFRAFVVEAFVIPTGSMAPTLLGAHMRYRCDDCGYDFEVNYQSQEGETDEVSIPSTARLRSAVPDPSNNHTPTINKTYRIHCPNCNYRMPRYNPADPYNTATNPNVYYGDRILVLKYLYLLTQPQRWDVVVFKSPADPQKFDYTQNYIKRLLGKPGESVLILDGDVYVSNKGKESRLQDFVVQSKPRWAQEALWRVVFDNDYQPRGKPRTITNVANQAVGFDAPFAPPWQTRAGEKGWDLSAKRVMKFSNNDATATIEFNPQSNPMTGVNFAPALTDWLAYDVTLNQSIPTVPDTYLEGGYVADNNVSDVKLELYYTRQSGDGPLKLNFAVRPGEDVERTFVAQIDRGNASLIMTDRSGNETAIGSAVIADSTGKPLKVELVHADYQVTLRVGGKDLISTTPQQYAPDLSFLVNRYNVREKLPKPRISITAEKQTAELRHVSLWRDVYYTNRERGTGHKITHPNEPTPLNWASPERFPERVIHLGPDEYFTCGDNSLISGDGRYWNQPINLPDEDLHADSGRVPGRFLLGKAFFVYWPAGYKPIAGESVPAIVPNFGRMRFIH
jgi:signal peptidase I